MSFLDIVIPHHNESNEMVERLLKSIMIQDGVDLKEDVKLIFVDDNSKDKIDPELLKKYDLNIEYYENEENLGPGLTRQRGLELSNANYVMFLDSDDELFNGAALHIITSCLKETGVDYLKTEVVVDFIDKDGKLNHGLCNYDAFADSLHGKVFKKEYILKHNISFSPKLKKMFEDAYFVKTFINADFNNLKTIGLRYPTYKWNFNENSITRKKAKHKAIVDNFNDFINCGVLQYDFLKKAKSPNADRILINCLFGVSIVLESNYFDGDDLEDKKAKYEDKLYKLYKKHEKLFANFETEDLNKMYESTLEAIKFNNSNLEVKQNFYEFVAMMDNREVN